MKLKDNIAVSESGFIFNPTTGDSYTANEIGLEIIKCLKEEISLEEITGLMIIKYDVDAQSFEKYYLDFEKELQKAGFLE